MPPKRKQPKAAPKGEVIDLTGDDDIPQATPESRAKKAKKETKKSTKETYTAAQKSAITSFQSFTQADRNTAVRFLKSNNWHLDQAVNGFFTGGASTTANPFKPNLNKIFDKFRDSPADNPDVIGVSGTMSYLETIGVSIEDIGMLVVSELVQSPTMGEMTREGFVDGWSAVSCDTLEKQKSHIANSLRALPLESSLPLFTRIYKHTFVLARPAGQKSVPLEMAVEYWRVLFSSPSSPVRWNTASTPWLDWWIEFLEAKWKKSVNKDVWEQTLKFANLALKDEKLSFWDENSAWPGVIDEFVEWVGERRGTTAGGEDGEGMDTE